MGVTRRDLLKASGAGIALTGIGLPAITLAAQKTVKIGFLAPLTGEVAAWGLPGLYGCEIWAEKVNEAGGIKVGDDQYLVEFVSFDNEYLPDKRFPTRLNSTKTSRSLPSCRARLRQSRLVPVDVNIFV